MLLVIIRVVATMARLVTRIEGEGGRGENATEGGNMR